MTSSSAPLRSTALRDLRAERGYSLIVAVSIVALLTMVGSMVLEQVYADTQLSGSERAAQNALYVADAGAVWGQMKLSNMVFPGGLDTASTAAPILSGLMALPPLPAGDPMCPDLSATACSQWLLLSPGPLPGWVAYGTNSNYRVAATCNPQPCSNGNTPINYSIRSMSLANDGSRRLVETVIGP